MNLDAILQSKVFCVIAFALVITICVLGVRSCVNERAAYKELERAKDELIESERREENQKQRVVEADKKAANLEGRMAGYERGVIDAQKARAEQTVRVEASEQKLKQSLGKRVVRVRDDETFSDDETLKAYERGMQP